MISVLRSSFPANKQTDCVFVTFGTFVFVTFGTFVFVTFGTFVTVFFPFQYAHTSIIIDDNNDQVFLEAMLL